MAKKIFDILPPAEGEVRQRRQTPPATSRKEELLPIFKRKKRWGIKEKVMMGWSPVIKKSLILFSAILILVGIFSYFFLGEARIEIWPVAEILNFKEDLTIDIALSETDPTLWLKGGTIPGKFLEEEKSLFRQFSSTGKALKEVKAEGIIRVYNNYQESISLVQNTRFLSADGKLFRSKERIYIPSGGFRDLKVQAAEAGEDYNVKPSTFSIPGLVGYPSYTAIYGKSFSSMEGGFRGEVPQLLEDDLVQAENILVEKLRDENRKNLEAKARDFVLLEEAIVDEVIEASSLAQAGAEIEQFSFLVKLKSKALVFNKEQLENFAKEFILTQIDSSKKLDEKSLKINYSLKSIDFKAGKILLSLEFSAKIFSEINFEELKQELRGKSEIQVKNFLSNQSEISRAQVKFWPFWLKKVPEDKEKIKLEIRID